MATSIGGTNYTDVGSSTAPLLLRSNGTIRCQWGGRFIDLIKNGKINADSGITIKTVTSEDEMTSDGIYVLNNAAYIVVDGVKIDTTSNNDSYITYTEKQELTSDQQLQFLKNIGLIVDSIDDIQITSGFVYVLSTNQLYKVENGSAQILIQSTNNSDTDFSVIDSNKSIDIQIDSESKLNISEKEMNVGTSNIILPTVTRIYTKLSDKSSGCYLEHNEYGATLYIDKVVQHNNSSTDPISSENILPSYILQSSKFNIIKSITDSEITLIYDNEFVVGDQIAIILDGFSPTNSNRIFISSVKEVTTSGLLIEDSISTDYSNVPIILYSDDIIYELNKGTITYKNFIENKIYSQFGVLDSLLPIDITKYPNAYSYTYSQILDNPKIFSPEFEGLLKYSDLEKPEDLTNSEYDSVIVPLSWIRDLITENDSNKLTADDLQDYVKSEDIVQEVPAGVIMLYNGNKAPGGWHLCDGTTENETTYPSLSFDQEGINYIIKI